MTRRAVVTGGGTGIGRAVAAARVADLTDPARVGELAAELVADGPVDVLVNNAGGNFGRGGADLAAVAAAWEADVRGNVLPSVLLTTALLPALARLGGRVVVMSSPRRCAVRAATAGRRRRCTRGRWAWPGRWRPTGSR